jgi:hypothetical protein
MSNNTEKLYKNCQFYCVIWWRKRAHNWQCIVTGCTAPLVTFTGWEWKQTNVTKIGINYINCTDILIQYCGFQMNGIWVFICNLINDTISNSHYTASNDYMTENLKGCGKGHILAFVWWAENHIIPQSWECPGHNFNQPPPKIQVQNINIPINLLGLFPFVGHITAKCRMTNKLQQKNFIL